MKTIMIIQIIIIIAIGTGWVKSIVKLSDCDFEAPYKAEIVYGAGIFIPPAGAIIGWLDMGK